MLCEKVASFVILSLPPFIFISDISTSSTIEDAKKMPYHFPPWEIYICLLH